MCLDSTDFDIIISLTALLPPNIMIVHDGNPIAGDTFTLLCTVILPDGLETEPQITWLSPLGNMLASEGELTVGYQRVIGNPSRVTTYMAQFSPVLTSHGGMYTCQATIRSLYSTIQQSVSRTQNISVQSMLYLNKNLLTNNYYYLQFHSLSCQYSAHQQDQYMLVASSM